MSGSPSSFVIVHLPKIPNKQQLQTTGARGNIICRGITCLYNTGRTNCVKNINTSFICIFEILKLFRCAQDFSRTRKIGVKQNCCSPGVFGRYPKICIYGNGRLRLVVPRVICKWWMKMSITDENRCWRKRLGSVEEWPLTGGVPSWVYLLCHNLSFIWSADNRLFFYFKPGSPLIRWGLLII